MVLQTLEDDYRDMAFLWQWAGSAQEAIHSQQSEHRRRSDNIIPNFIYYLKYYFFIIFTWLDNLCLDIIWLNKSMHCNELSNISAMYFCIGRAPINPVFF